MSNRELDVVIAEKVMGWKQDKDTWWSTDQGVMYDDEMPPFSTDISAAWEVVRHLENGRFPMRWEIKQDGYDDGSIEVRFWSGPRMNYEIHHAIEETAPLAICKAALKAVGAVLGNCYCKGEK